MLVTFTIKIIGILLGLLTTALLARMLGAEGYGVYVYSLAIITVLSIPAQLGMPELVVRETAKYMVDSKTSYVYGLWKWSSSIVLLVTLLIISFVFSWQLLIVNSPNSDDSKVLLVALFLIPFISLGNLRGAALRGLKNVIIGQLPEMLVRPLVLVLLLIMMYLFSETLTPIYAMKIYVVSAFIAFLVGAFLLFKKKPENRLNRNEYDKKNWIYAALPLSLISGMHMISSQADIIMINMFADSKQVGLYKVVVSISSLVAFGLQSMNMVVAPSFAELYKKNCMIELQDLVRRSARVVMLLSFLSLLLLVLFGRIGLDFFFGPEYTQGYFALILLAVGQFLNSIFGSVGSLLKMTGHEREAVKAVLLALIINIVLNYFLIPVHGILGAAFASIITLVVWNFYMWLIVRQKIGINASMF